MADSSLPPPVYPQRNTRSSLNKLLADNIMVQQLMDYEKQNGYTLVQVPYEQKHLDPDKKIETRLNVLNQELEKELLEFKEKFPTTPSADKKSSIGNRIRRSLFPAKKDGKPCPWNNNSPKTKKRPSFTCLILILILLAILVTSLTLILVFTINQPHNNNNNNMKLKEALNSSSVDSTCASQINCFNNGKPILKGTKCICLCGPGLTGEDCRTLIVPPKDKPF